MDETAQAFALSSRCRSLTEVTVGILVMGVRFGCGKVDFISSESVILLNN